MRVQCGADAFRGVPCSGVQRRTAPNAACAVPRRAGPWCGVPVPCRAAPCRAVLDLSEQPHQPVLCRAVLDRAVSPGQTMPCCIAPHERHMAHNEERIGGQVLRYLEAEVRMVKHGRERQRVGARAWNGFKVLRKQGKSFCILVRR